MPGPLNQIVLTLLECTLTLYPANAIGEPILDQPLWMGSAAHDLTVRDRWIKTETRPTGAKYPRRHPLVPQFEISIGRVWTLPLAQLEGFIPGRGRYVLDVVWRDEDNERKWHREVFYGVTISERDRGARDRDGEFTENQSFDAEYFVPTSGSGTPPAIPGTLYYSVRYLSAAENVELYRYDPDTDYFTESVAGSTTNRATVSYAPDHSGILDVLFAGEPYPSLRVNADREVEVFALRQGSPTQADLPRVEFWYGTNRVAAVTRAGALHATKFLALNPLEGNKFQFFADGELALTFEAAGATGNFTVFTPQTVGGLKLWTRVESLGLNDRDEVVLWPDESGHGNDLVQGGGLLTESGEELLTEDEEPLLLEDSLDGDGPALHQSPHEDEWTHHPIPVTGGALRFRNTQFLRTAGDIVDADNFTLFVVACPFGPGGGVATDQTLIGGNDTANQYLLQITDVQKARAKFYPEFLGTPTENSATGVTLGTLTQRIGWHLFEVEAAARRFTEDLTIGFAFPGTLPEAVYSYVLVDVEASGPLSPSTTVSLDLTGSGGMFKVGLGLPAAPGGTTERRLYRNKVSAGTEFYLLATLAASATAYEDNQSMAAFAATNPVALAGPPRAGFLTLRVDGVQQATVADLVGLATDTEQPLQVGAESGGFYGYVKAILLYEGNLSEGDKDRVRRFLNNAYGIY